MRPGERRERPWGLSCMMIRRIGEGWQFVVVAVVHAVVVVGGGVAAAAAVGKKDAFAFHFACGWARKVVEVGIADLEKSLFSFGINTISKGL